MSETVSQPIEPYSATVLVADDDSSIREVLRIQLSKVGYDVLLARDGQEALDMACTKHPDLILLDILMPRLDGFETCVKLKEDDVTSGIPIVILSALGNSAERVKALELGVDDFINKPIDRVELLARVRSLLRVRRLYDSLADSNVELQAAYTSARDAESRYRSLVNDALDAVFVVDAESGLIREVNEAACALCGVDNDDLVGHALAWICPQAPDEPIDNPLESQLVRPDAAHIPVLIKVSAVSSLTGNLLQYTVRDLTSIRELESHRMQAERLSAIVETAVTVNDQVNTPLAVIITNAEALKKTMRGVDSQSFTRLEQTLEAAGRIQQVMSQLAQVRRAVSKEYLPGTSMLDLDRAIEPEIEIEEMSA